MSHVAATPPRVLIVEDESTVAEVVERYLRREGFSTAIAGDGESALKQVSQSGFDLVILDLMLPGVDGVEVCRHIRSDGNTPIIMLTAKNEPSDVVLGLGLGADDYVAKPFSPAELVARVHAVLRRGARAPENAGPVLRFSGIQVDGNARTVARDGVPVTLTAREFDLLYFMASRPGQVFSREHLMHSVWDYSHTADTSTVTVHMRRLRSKIEVDPERPRHLRTVWGVGYKFEP